MNNKSFITKKYFVVFFYVLLLFFYFNGCNTETEPIPIGKTDPYISLQIGDIKQYADSEKKLFFQSKIIDTTHRSDGQKVYIMEESYALSDGIYKANNYYFIKDGFFTQTALDTVKEPEINYENPFLEFRLAEEYPKQGDYFLRTKGVPDSEKVFFRVNLIDSFKTTIKSFNNVAEYKVIDNSVSAIKGASYYSKDYGHIGSILISNKDTVKIFVIYSKIANKELGKYVTIFEKKSMKIKKYNSIDFLDMDLK